MSIQPLSADFIRDTMPQYRPGTGSDRYVRFCEEALGIQLGATQSRLLEALEEHRRVVGVGGNGVGKSYGIGGAGSIASLYCNLDCTVNITSGSYGQLDDTIWKPIKSIHRNSPLPGRTLDNKRELKSGIDEEWYLKCLSPQYPADLEGRHNRRMVYIIEEADKPGITHEHIDSAESTLTDSDDRLFVIANPPEDESNVVYDLMQSPKWETIEFSSFESHNVQIDTGSRSGEKIPGLVDISEIKENWEAWNGEDWPGYEQAFRAHEERDDLDIRWYRRRAGVIPPAAAGVHRPFTVADVRSSFEASIKTVGAPDGLAMDVARTGGDSNVLATMHTNENFLAIVDRWSGVDHVENEARVRKQLGDGWDAPFPVDANGEGSGLADRIDTFYPKLFRYDAGSEPEGDETEYYSCWGEALYCLGQFLKNGGAFANRRLREELLVAARVIEYEEKFYKSRDSTVLKATPKDDVKEQLGRSPDCLDAAMMAVWARDVQPTENPDPYAYSFS